MFYPLLVSLLFKMSMMMLTILIVITKVLIKLIRNNNFTYSFLTITLWVVVNQKREYKNQSNLINKINEGHLHQLSKSIILIRLLIKIR
jgi:hypothetical protein